MDSAEYEKLIIEDPDLPILVLENDKTPHSHRQRLCGLHWHEHLELHYILEGSLELWVNHGQYILQKGDLMVLNPNAIHTSFFSGRLRERIIIFTLENLSPSLAANRMAFQRLIRQDAYVSSLVEAFDTEYNAQFPGFQMACKATILQLLVHLTRNFALSTASDREYRKRVRQLQRLQPVRLYIAQHYSESIDTELLAELVYLSKDRFNHLFKECMGIPLRKYINDIRLNNAYGWLEQGKCTPAEAFARSGFTDYNHFRRLFRQTFGCTPSQVLPRIK